MNYRSLLTAAGMLSLAVAAFHVALAFSADLSEFFGSGPAIARMLREHDPVIYVITFSLVIVFALCGLYGLSGAGRFARLPLLRTGLLTIGAIYLLRGLMFFPELLCITGIIRKDIPLQNLLSSAVSLSTGLCFLLGAIGLMRRRVVVS